MQLLLSSSGYFAPSLKSERGSDKDKYKDKDKDKRVTKKMNWDVMSMKALGGIWHGLRLRPSWYLNKSPLVTFDQLVQTAAFWSKMNLVTKVFPGAFCKGDRLQEIKITKVFWKFFFYSILQICLSQGESFHKSAIKGLSNN